MEHRMTLGSNARRWGTAVLVALALALGPGSGFAEDDEVMPPPVEESAPPPGASESGEDAATPEALPPPRNGFARPGAFVSEVVDSSYFIEPAEFFAIDLPVNARGGARAVHLLGDISVLGGRRDIVVRLFRSSDYQDWLKRRGGRHGKPFWTSSRQRAIRLDQDLPVGQGVVLLLDNGYSLRTPKRVRVQLQMQYEGAGSAAAVEASNHPAPPAPQEGDITPRSNEDSEFAPPPPPPSEDEGK